MDPPKRPPSNDPQNPRKRQKTDRMNEIDEQLDSLVEIPLIDSRQLQILSINLQRRIAENIDLRIKHQDEPIKFMDSEEVLHETIKLFEGIAADPERTVELMESSAAKDLVMLLSHDNVDIAAEVSKVLFELAEESELAASKLYQLGSFEALKNNLRRMDERDDEEFQGVYYTLGIIEAIVEKGDFECKDNEGEVLEWLLLKLHDEEFSTNRLYASEILSTLMLNPSVRAESSRFYMTERLMSSLSLLLESDPEGEDEREMYENIMDCLAMCLLDSQSRDNFRENSGIKLALTLLKGRSKFAANILKVLDSALLKTELNIVQLVKDNGLGLIFAFLLQKMSKHPETITTMASLLRSLLSCKDQDCLRRVYYKFRENNCEKLQIIVNLWNEYDQTLEIDYDRLLQDEEYYIDCYAETLYPKLCTDFIMLTLMSAGDDLINGLIKGHVDLQRVTAEVRAWEGNTDEEELKEALRQLLSA